MIIKKLLSLMAGGQLVTCLLFSLFCPGLCAMEESTSAVQAGARGVKNIFGKRAREQDKAPWVYPTFHHWDAACSKLPQFRTIFANSPEKLTAYEHKADKLTLEEFSAALRACTAVYKQGLFVKPEYWVGGVAPEPEFFTNDDIEFKPYTQKLRVPVNTNVIFHGDLHGDIHSLLKSLRNLSYAGYLSVEDPFLLERKDVHLVFLGDYVDRGLYGVEVIYTLSRLKIANPDQVHLVRGNHEDLSQNIGYETCLGKELIAKFGFDNTDFKKTMSQIKLVDQLYKLCPVALYVCCGADDHLDALQCCHGGMEPGYNPRQLLARKKDTVFQWISRLNRKNRINNGLPTLSDADRHRCQQFANGQNVRNNIAQYWQNLEDLTPEELGFMWADFGVEQPEYCLGLQHYPRWVFGKKLTDAILAEDSTDAIRVCGVFRAHQHTGQWDAMMKSILDYDGTHPDDKGVSKLWRFEENKGKQLWDGIVCTFNVAPDTPYGCILAYNFDTYGILTTAAAFKDWRLSIERVSVVEKNDDSAVH